MSGRPIVAAAVVLFLALGMMPARALDTPAPVGMYALPYTIPVHTPPAVPRDRQTRTMPKSIIGVTFSDNFPEDAKPAMLYAAQQWTNQLSSPEVIQVTASWVSKNNAGLLADCAPSDYVRMFPGLPNPLAWYPIGLANALVGFDLNPLIPDMRIEFNADRDDWYFGTDGQTPDDKYDMASVAMHEMGHGLGMTSTFKEVLGYGLWGYKRNDLSSMFVYDLFLADGSGHLLLDSQYYTNLGQGLGSALLGGNVIFKGANAMDASTGSGLPRIYAPNPWAPGSSISHLDESIYPAGNANALMTPGGGRGESEHNPGPIVRGILRDIGWTINPEPDLDVVAASPSKITLTAGQTFALAVKLHNKGDAPATAFTVGIFLDRNTAPTFSDTPDKVVQVAGLTSGATMTINVPNLTYNTPGTYKVWALADGGITQPEPDRTNNVRVASPVTMQASARPDMAISNPGEAVYSGADIYGVSAGQTKTQSVPVNVNAVYYVALTNRGNVPDSYTLTGPGNAVGWTVHYSDYGGGADYTAAITSTGLYIPTVYPGDVRVLRITVTPVLGALLFTSHQVTLRVASNLNSGKTDLVCAVAKRVRVSEATLAADPPTIHYTGQPILLTAKAIGGLNLTYKFRVGELHGQWIWKDLTDFTSANTYTWTPANSGSYRVLVQVRESDTAAAYDATSPLLNLGVVDALSAVSVAASPAATSLTGHTVILSAKATGGHQLAYAFTIEGLARLGGIAPDVAPVNRPYSPLATTWWTPSVPGMYRIVATARDASSGATQSASINYTVVPSLTAVSLAAAPALSMVPVGSKVVLTAAATGGGSVEYRFLFGSRPSTITPTSGIVWDRTMAYRPYTTTWWTPATPGLYNIRVYAHEVGSAAAYDAASSVLPTTDMMVNVVPALSGFKVTCTPAGTTGAVTIATEPTGGANLRWKVLALKSGSIAWTPVRDYSPYSTTMWVPPSGGAWTIRVYAKEVTSAAAFDKSVDVSYGR